MTKMFNKIDENGKNIPINYQNWQTNPKLVQKFLKLTKTIRNLWRNPEIAAVPQNLPQTLSAPFLMSGVNVLKWFIWKVVLTKRSVCKHIALFYGNICLHSVIIIFNSPQQLSEGSVIYEGQLRAGNLHSIGQYSTLAG